VLRFDNLTGDSSLDWITTAAPAILAAEWNGVSRKVALLAATVRDGYLESASRLAHGYFERRGGKLWFCVLVEDANRHTITAEQTAAGDLLSAINGIARRIEPASRAFSTGNEEAVEQWGHGNFERGVTLDPDFSGAWLAWVESLAAAGDSQHALDVGTRALMRSGLRSPLDRARIEFAVASLRRDENARLAALTEISRLSPMDAGALRALAQATFAARRFAEAERAYRELIRLDPADASALNTLGYVQAMAGEPDQAKTSLGEYGRRPGQSVNALDSLGEAMFLNGRFQEAEKAFLQSYRENPAFLDGAGLWKAAHAHWLGGDLHGADELIKTYLEARTRARDPLVAWREGAWLYETGRQEQAIALLMQSPSEGELLEQQLAVWRSPDVALGAGDLDRWKQLYERADPLNDGLVRTLYASALLGAGRKEEARKLAAIWPLPKVPASPLDSLIYPRWLDLKRRLQ